MDTPLVEKQMEHAARIALICEGDAEADAFSGSAKYMVNSLRDLGHSVTTANVRLEKPWRVLNAVRTFSPDRKQWQSRFRYGAGAFRGRSARAAKALSNLSGQVDAIIQIGATFAPPPNTRLPLALYCDWNMALSIGESRESSVNGLTQQEAEVINRRQRDVYSSATVIFTICERLRESFLQDYGIPAERVVRAYAGVNLDSQDIPAKVLRRSAERPPTILFVGKEFARKGGDVLLDAFRIVRQKVPSARLIIIGHSGDGIDRPGVEMLGTLRKDIPEQRRRLYEAFRSEADIFCLPSRRDPFPNVVREAMVFGLPCVTTDIWAFPEMVVDGSTGFTVPPGDPHQLAERLCRLLLDRELSYSMGCAGRARVDELFRWSKCGAIISDQIQRSLGRPSVVRHEA